MSVTLDDIRAAADRIGDRAVRTQLLESPLLNERIGCRLLVKAECLQLTGSFKFRGAYNLIRQLSADEIARGVVAYSTGNHAQGVAAAAHFTGATATIVVPEDVPAIKRRNTEAWGAALAFYDRARDDREEAARRVAAEKGNAVIVPPFDDPRIMAGQGTAGLELIEQARRRGIDIDAVVIPCGGGGLAAGVSTAVKALSPRTQVFMAEPESFDDTRRSFAAGKRVAIDPKDQPPTICDALTVPAPGELTFEVNRRTVAGVIPVADCAVRAAMYAAFDNFKIVLEPSGAVALATVTSGGLAEACSFQGKTVAVVCSGGNVDPKVFREALQAGAS